jgi:hypothetical protein
MPTEPIPFVNQQASGWERLAGASPQAMNVVVDGRGAVRRRPGIAVYDKVLPGVIDADGIDGVHATNTGKLYVAGGESPPGSRKLYRLTGTGTNELGGIRPKLVGGERPIFAETEAIVVATAGDKPQKVDLVTDASARLGGDPPRSTHILTNTARLLSNDLDVLSQISFSGQSLGSSTTGNETWTPGVGLAGFFQAEARADPVLAVAENTNEIFAFGRTNVQVFAPAGAPDDYATVSTREYGCAAPYSVIKIDQSFAWMDNHRRIVVSDGRKFEIISDPIDADLDDLARVDDCFGYRVHEGQVDCLVFTFPSVGRTFAHQMDGGWAQWQGWDDATNNWKQFRVSAHNHDNVNTKNVVGTVDGRVGVLLREQQTDLGERINAYVTTGFQSRGTDRKKHCRSVRFVLQRGQSAEAVSPAARFTYRDDEGDWEDWIPISLGSAADRSPVVEFRSLGVYRRREWKFDFSDAETLVLALATEEFDVLDN